MASLLFYRSSGLSVLVGAIAFMIYLVLRSLVTAGLDPTTFAQHSF